MSNTSSSLKPRRGWIVILIIAIAVIIAAPLAGLWYRYEEARAYHCTHPNEPTILTKPVKC